jgi:hypothetical protein
LFGGGGGGGFGGRNTSRKNRSTVSRKGLFKLSRGGLLGKLVNEKNQRQTSYEIN